MYKCVWNWAGRQATTVHSTTVGTKAIYSRRFPNAFIFQPCVITPSPLSFKLPARSVQFAWHWEGCLLHARVLLLLAVVCAVHLELDMDGNELTDWLVGIFALFFFIDANGDGTPSTPRRKPEVCWCQSKMPASIATESTRKHYLGDNQRGCHAYLGNILLIVIMR